jgi:hypothetical protein
MRASSAPAPIATPRWQQVGAWAGVAVAVLIVVDLFTLSSSPSIGSSADEVVRHLRGNTALTLSMSYLGAVSAVLLLPFLASLHTFVQVRDDAAEWRWTVTLLSGAVASSALLLGSAARAAAAILADDGAGSAAVAGLFAAAKVTLSFSLLPIASVVLANARTMATSPIPVRWLIRFGAQIGLLSLLSSLSVFFVNDNWFGPGETAVSALGLILSMWLVSVAVTILRGEA